MLKKTDKLGLRFWWGRVGRSGVNPAPGRAAGVPCGEGVGGTSLKSDFIRWVSSKFCGFSPPLLSYNFLPLPEEGQP